MSRLIDADVLLEHIKKLECHAENKKYEQGLNDCLQFYFPQIIDKQSTAYDVENVVAELEEMIKPKQFYFCKYAKGGCKYIDDDKKDCMECVVEHAIAIARKGGIE